MKKKKKTCTHTRRPQQIGRCSASLLPFIPKNSNCIFRFTFYVQSAESDLLKIEIHSGFALFSIYGKGREFSYSLFRRLSVLSMVLRQSTEKRSTSVVYAFHRIPEINIRFHLTRQIHFIIEWIKKIVQCVFFFFSINRCIEYDIEYCISSIPL